MSILKPALYVVATPIGNLRDISQRAGDILTQVDLIAAEDTRNSARLLQHLGSKARTISLHEHNEARRCELLIEKLAAGEAIALISDAGTPVINDPGYLLVRAVRQAGFPVVPIPGPSALVTALSVAGIAVNHFSFDGFLPAKPAARRKFLSEQVVGSRTQVLFESPHRIVDTLRDMADILGNDREIALVRELTKVYETVLLDSVGNILTRVSDDPNQQKGEFVLIISPAPRSDANEELDRESRRVLELLMRELPLKKAARLTAEITGKKKNALYDYGLTLSED